MLHSFWIKFASTIFIFLFIIAKSLILKREIYSGKLTEFWSVHPWMFQYQNWINGNNYVAFSKSKIFTNCSIFMFSSNRNLISLSICFCDASGLYNKASEFRECFIQLRCYFGQWDPLGLRTKYQDSKLLWEFLCT